MAVARVEASCAFGKRAIRSGGTTVLANAVISEMAAVIVGWRRPASAARLTPGRR